MIAGGEFYGSVDFGGTILTQASYSAFVAKYSGVHGGLVWVKAFPASSQASARVAATSGTEILVSGTHLGTMTVGSTVLDPTISSHEMFALGLDASGNATWAKRYGGALNEEPLAAVGRGGAYYLAGSFASQADFGGTLITSKGGEDAFVARIKPSDGSVTLALGFGSAGDDRANGVAVAANGEIVGQSGGAINSGGGPLTFSGAPDGFLARFGTTGTHLSSKGFGTIGSDYVYSAGYAGTSLVITGSYSSGGIVDLGTGVLPTAGSSFLAHLVP